MKKTKIACFSAILFFAGISFAYSFQEEQALVIAFNDTISKPWKWKENGQYVGPYLDVMHEVAKRCGFNLVLKPMPWKRVLTELKQGSIDGAIGGYKTPERETFADFLDAPIGWAVLAIFVGKGKEFNFQKIEDLYGKKIGIGRGYTTSPEFDQAVTDGKITVEQVGKYENLVKMLNTGRIDGIAGAKSALQAHLADMKMANRFAVLPHPIASPKPVYICISKYSNRHNRENVIAKMNKAMRAMADEDIFDNIAKAYGYDKCIVFGCVNDD